MMVVKSTNILDHSIRFKWLCKHQTFPWVLMLYGWVGVILEQTRQIGQKFLFRSDFKQYPGLKQYNSNKYTPQPFFPPLIFFSFVNITLSCPNIPYPHLWHLCWMQSKCQRLISISFPLYRCRYDIKNCFDIHAEIFTLFHHCLLSSFLPSFLPSHTFLLTPFSFFILHLPLHI